MLEVQANGFGPCVLSYGGDTFNTSVYLRRCSSPAAIEVSYATGLGLDPLSQQLTQAWSALGLNLNAIQSIDGKLPGMYLIETDDKGERSFHFWRESSAARAYFHASETVLEKTRTLTTAFTSAVFHWPFWTTPLESDCSACCNKCVRQDAVWSSTTTSDLSFGPACIWPSRFTSKLWPFAIPP